MVRPNRIQRRRVTQRKTQAEMIINAPTVRRTRLIHQAFLDRAYSGLTARVNLHLAICNLLDVPSTVYADRLASDEIALNQRERRLRNLHLSAPSSQRRGGFDRA